MSELEKYGQARDAMQTIREFMEWVESSRLELAVRRGDRLLPSPATIDQLLYGYFKIDTVKLENERRALLNRASTTTRQP